MKKIFLPALTRALNHYLKLDVDSASRLALLEGKAITIEILPFHFTFQCVFTQQQVKIKTDDLQPADTHLSGTPLPMLSVMASKNHRQRFFADDIRIEGNAEVGQLVMALFDDLHIDWEDQLSHYLGDVSAYQVGRLLRGIGKWLQDTEKCVTQDVNEFIHEEALWFPTRVALDDFFHDVDTLREEVDRIEAKINSYKGCC